MEPPVPLRRVRMNEENRALGKAPATPPPLPPEELHLDRIATALERIAIALESLNEPPTR